ncbi:DeoR/GlpR family DNA-binding transcription regulator [Alkalihalobacterium alkalinitrilicum]|uniref:DeoR/GlpR family DNA-binding transcription regulator n=1 Tax=Alkalihalobacterium alkalinitrilicum TaxID=427920 RepID=UPI000994DA07|nr:DeoR/GlpR family DNA-binding transcription regulator [Alkalihalobacterium alkalinitrilicum]
MLTAERHQLILSLLHDKEIVKLQEFVEATNASDSTIRRDLTDLEKANKLKRVHGGASLIKKRLIEPTIAEKTVKNNQEKVSIAKFASQFIDKGDSIYLDAGTTVTEMIPFIKDKEIVVVTNAINNINTLIEHGIETHVIGGLVKSATKAFVGRAAIQGIETFRFDKVFLGANGIHPEYGITTPDTQEAFVKECALSRAQQAFLLVDHTKFGEISFAKIADIDEVTIITSSAVDQEVIKAYKKKTDIKVVDR